MESLSTLQASSNGAILVANARFAGDRCDVKVDCLFLCWNPAFQGGFFSSCQIPADNKGTPDTAEHGTISQATATSQLQFFVALQWLLSRHHGVGEFFIFEISESTLAPPKNLTAWSARQQLSDAGSTFLVHLTGTH